MCYHHDRCGGLRPRATRTNSGTVVVPKGEEMAKENGSTAEVGASVPAPSNGSLNGDALEASMQLAHAEFVAAARLRVDMDGHLNRAMEAKLNLNVAMAGAKYVKALDAYEASA